MRPLLTTVFAFGFGVLAATAQTFTTIEGVIADQLQAFNDRDLDRAFGHASPMIQRLFGGPENFGIMVERAYPMVWDNRNARFLQQREEAGSVFQSVLIEGASGGSYVLVYKMIQTPDGWLIDGVDFGSAPDLSA